MAETVFVVDVAPATVDLAPESVLAEEEVATIDLPDAMPSVEDESVGPDNIPGYKEVHLILIWFNGTSAHMGHFSA